MYKREGVHTKEDVHTRGRAYIEGGVPGRWECMRRTCRKAGKHL